MPEAHAPLLLTRLRLSQAEACRDEVAVEEPLEIRVAFGGEGGAAHAGGGADRPLVLAMRTPGGDAELAAGFLLGEGILRAREELLAIEPTADPNVVRVRLAAGLEPRLPSAERHFYRTSSCGVCGKASIAAARAVPAARSTATRALRASVLYGLPATLRSAQPAFARTGGLHAAALFDFDGALLATREDVGRHNAVDKLLGGEWLAGRMPLTDRVLLLSGRASFELVQKAMAAGVSVVASLGAPSSLAVDLARDAGITLAGFVEAGRANLYAHPGRISPGEG